MIIGTGRTPRPCAKTFVIMPTEKPTAPTSLQKRTPPNTSESFPAEPHKECELCPRLVRFRHANRSSEPEWFNGAVPSFGNEKASLLVVGLAPGLKGANCTGRPFTGDYAGNLLYATLIKFGFAKGKYDARIDDGLKLINCMITNAVRCVPPENKPTTDEIKACRPYFIARLAALPNLKAILALGRIAHDQILTSLEKRKSEFKFAHGAQHQLNDKLSLYDSFHCSRYNTNTGRLTEKMFHDVFETIKSDIATQR